MEAKRNEISTLLRAEFKKTEKKAFENDSCQKMTRLAQKDENKSATFPETLSESKDPKASGKKHPFVEITKATG